MSAIYILWLRQLKRYIRSRSRIVGSLGQPLLFLLALGYGIGPIFQRAGQGNYLEFLAPGVIGMSIIFSSIFSGMEIIWDRQFGFLKETLVAPVSRLNIMIGRTLGGATIATLQGIIVFAITLIAGFRPFHWGLVFPAILVMFLVALLFTAFGTAIASRLEDMQGFQLIMNFMVMPLFFCRARFSLCRGFLKYFQLSRALIHSHMELMHSVLCWWELHILAWQPILESSGQSPQFFWFSAGTLSQKFRFDMNSATSYLTR